MRFVTSFELIQFLMLVIRNFNYLEYRVFAELAFLWLRSSSSFGVIYAVLKQQTVGAFLWSDLYFLFLLQTEAGFPIVDIPVQVVDHSLKPCF